MRVLLEGGAFITLAIGAHLFIAGMSPEETASSSAGDGGAAMMSLQASSASVEAMVEQWELTPEVEIERPMQITQPDAPAPELSIETPIVEAVLRPKSPVQLENTFLNEGVSLPNTVPPKPLEVREPEPVLDQASEAVSVVKPVLRPKIPPRAVVKPQPVRKSTPAPAPKKSVPVKPKASQASAASQTQKAAGSGGTTSAGNSNSSAATARQTKAAATALSRWYSSIRAQVERRKRGGKGSGTVGLRVTVGRTGALQSVSVGKSSGNSSLDGLALNAVKSAGRFARAPKSATNASYHIAFSMVFQ